MLSFENIADEYIKFLISPIKTNQTIVYLNFTTLSYERHRQYDAR